METYSGFEPQVGEIRALRTFRIGPEGALYPLFSDIAWAAGENRAGCKAVASVMAPQPHSVPDPDCTCGYYAYGSESAAGEYPNARHVLAVVSCWGHVIAGTRGIRAQYARIDAIWMSATVPAELGALVAARYPEVVIYADKQDMLVQRPPTVLDCYELDSPQDARSRIWLRLAVVGALVVGSLPARWLGSNTDAFVIWAAELCFFVVAAVLTYRRRTDFATKRQSLVYIAVVLWLLSPYAGAAGILMLRLPLVQIVTLGAAHRWSLTREASRFPSRIGRRTR